MEDTFILLQELYDKIEILKFNYKVNSCSTNYINDCIENVIKCYNNLKEEQNED